jgi:hypothetical protein
MSLGYRGASPRIGRSSVSGIVPLKRLAGVSWEKREAGRRRTKRKIGSRERGTGNGEWGLGIVSSYTPKVEK